uniref:Uncharacterized protein n=1 Tax=Cucumis melo TaxID=3656 RepID=A0A9I9EKS1_CUCME
MAESEVKLRERSIDRKVGIEEPLLVRLQWVVKHVKKEQHNVLLLVIEKAHGFLSLECFTVETPASSMQYSFVKYIDGFVKYIVGYVMKHFGEKFNEAKNVVADLVRGFEKSSAIQQRGIIPLCKGEENLRSLTTLNLPIINLDTTTWKPYYSLIEMREWRVFLFAELTHCDCYAKNSHFFRQKKWEVGDNEWERGKTTHLPTRSYPQNDKLIESIDLLSGLVHDFDFKVFFAANFRTWFLY